MFKEIEQLLLQHKRLSLRELCTHFDMQPDALTPMLELLERKGKVEIDRSACDALCKGCSCADPSNMVVVKLPDSKAS